MKILSEMEQTLERIEADIAHVVQLRKAHIEEDAKEIFIEVDNKISGLKAWVADVKHALHIGKSKIAAMPPKM